LDDLLAHRIRDAVPDPAGLGRSVLEAFGPKVFDTIIRKTVRFAEAPVAGEPILSYAPKSLGAMAYRKLAEEVMSRVAPRQSARG
jgi:cellulose biosynthesis protein BcsQ